MDDRARVEALLGRAPRGSFEVVVRDEAGEPVVIRNAPLLDDGTPMPTLYYLVGDDLVRRVSRLEAAGGVKQAEAAVPAVEIAAAHRRYADERDAAIPVDHQGPRPAGGVGGTRVGVKCLHAHVAYTLAGGDDPVGRWALDQIAVPDGDVLHVDIADDELTVWTPGGPTVRLPAGPRRLSLEHLDGRDPPAPEQLTNALGAVSDHLDDALIEAPQLVEAQRLAVGGHHATVLARVELGRDAVPPDYVLHRGDVDEVFRTLATEPRAERLANPGLPSDDVDTVVATCCVVLAVLRRLELQVATLDVAAGTAPTNEVAAWR